MKQRRLLVISCFFYFSIQFYFFKFLQFIDCTRDDCEIDCYYTLSLEKEDYNPKFQITKENTKYSIYSRYLPLNCVHLNDNIRRIRVAFITSPYNTSINKRVAPRHKGCFWLCIIMRHQFAKRTHGIQITGVDSLRSPRKGTLPFSFLNAVRN